jgi:hypothetical protein
MDGQVTMNDRGAVASGVIVIIAAQMNVERRQQTAESDRHEADERHGPKSLTVTRATTAAQA